MPFTRYLQVLAEHARGENLPPNHVPSTFLFAFTASRIVGRVSIRHELNEFLVRVGGHIGYAVVPAFVDRALRPRCFVCPFRLRTKHSALTGCW